jgi:hypothetical protein
MRKTVSQGLPLRDKSVKTITPKWEVWVYTYIPAFIIENKFDLLQGDRVQDISNDIRSRFSFEDVVFASKPWQIPNEIIHRFNYRDSTDFDSNFRIVLPNASRLNLLSETGTQHAITEILLPGSIVVFKENGDVKFAGQIRTISETSAAEGEADYVATGSGLDQMIRNLNLFIDTPSDERSSVSMDPEDASVDRRPALQVALESYSRIAKQYRNPYSLVKQIARETIDNLLSNGEYGGKNFIQILNFSRLISSRSYTTGYIHSINWLQNAQLGEELNYWNLMDTFATAPLYELFIHYDQSCSMGADETTFLRGSMDSELPNLDFDSEADPPKEPIGNLLFRKTPIDKLDRTFYDSRYHCEYHEAKISHIELRETIDDLFSGVHVSLGVLDNRTRNIAYPVTWNPDLISQFGSKILRIVLDGVGVPSDVPGPIQKRMTMQIANVQKDFFKVFGSGDYIISGQIQGDYSRGICKGKFVDISGDADIGARHPILRRFFDGGSFPGITHAPRFYITAIEIDVDPSEGKCEMSLDVKWGSRGWRKQRDPSFASIQTPIEEFE